MGFDQRSHRRIPLSSHIRFWMEAENSGFGLLGEALNLSESGLAFTAEKPVQKGERLRLEFKLPDRSGYLRVLSQVVHCEPAGARSDSWQLRVRFQELAGEELMRMRRVILETSDPKLAATTGWGKVLVKGMPTVSAQYRDLGPDQFQGWREDTGFLAADGIAHLARFQELLVAALGGKTPETLRLQGTRRTQEKSRAWVELALPRGCLRLLGETIWSKQDPEAEAEAGLRVLAYSKEDATRLDKPI